MNAKTPVEFLQNVADSLYQYRTLLVTLYGNKKEEIAEVDRQIIVLDRVISRQAMKTRDGEYITGFPYG